MNEYLELFKFLTDRECDVLDALKYGLAVDEIAAKLYVNVATVRTHVQHIFAKLGVRSQAAAIALAWQTGWTPEMPVRRRCTRQPIRSEAPRRDGCGRVLPSGAGHDYQVAPR